MNTPSVLESRHGILLVNLGTPDQPEVPEVRKYLREFLMDPDVIDIPLVFRALLVHGWILRTRPKVSAAAYRKIWLKEGSPLRVHHENLVRKVQDSVPSSCIVRGAMRYGNPSIESALRELALEKISDLTVFPLYPQYSLAATESSLRKCAKVASEILPGVTVRSIDPFYNDPGFIKAYAQIAKDSLRDFDFDHVLMSFHGLPERQIQKTDSTGAHCFSSNHCCDLIGDTNSKCYRAQCYATARGIADEMKLPVEKTSVSFQSRLGRTPWIRPFTDHILAALPKQGVRKLAVLCPSFVADCLETLEEIQIRGKELFVENGGEDLRLVPCLNSHPLWAEAVVDLLRRV